MANTIKIKLLTSVAGGDYSYAAGEEVDAPEDIAKDLLQAGHAKLVGGQTPADKAEKAISPAAQNAEKR